MINSQVKFQVLSFNSKSLINSNERLMERSSISMKFNQLGLISRMNTILFLKYFIIIQGQIFCNRISQLPILKCTDSSKVES